MKIKNKLKIENDIRKVSKWHQKKKVFNLLSERQQKLISQVFVTTRAVKSSTPTP